MAVMVAAVGVRLGRPQLYFDPSADRAVELCAAGVHASSAVQVDLGAEAAADVGRDHAHLVIQAGPRAEGRHQQALDVRVLVGDVERVLVL